MNKKMIMLVGGVVFVVIAFVAIAGAVLFAGSSGLIANQGTDGLGRGLIGPSAMAKASLPGTVNAVYYRQGSGIFAERTGGKSLTLAHYTCG